MHAQNSAKKSNRKIWISVVTVLSLTALVLLIITLDIGGDLVAREAQDTAKAILRADLSLGQVKGNPLRGYKILGVDLSKDGAEMFKAEFLEVKINLMSLFSSPRLSLLSVGGVNMDLDKIAEEFSKLPGRPSGEPFQVPIDELKLVRSVFTSKWGKVEIEDVGLGFDQYTITANVKGKVNALAVSGTLAAEITGTRVILENADLKVGKGTVKASGQLSDTLDAQGVIEGIDVTDLVSLFPTLAPEDYVGTVGMSFRATGAWTDPVFTATANFKGARVAGWPVESFDSTVNYKDLRLSLDEITANILGIPLAGNVAMAFSDAAPDLLVQLSGGPADLASLEDLGDTKGITGSVSDFTIDIKGTAGAPSGTISLHAPAIGFSGVKGTDIALQVKLTGGSEAAVNGKMKLQGADSYLSGTVSDLLSAPKLSLTFKAVELNTAALKPMMPEAVDLKGTVTAEVHIKGAVSDPSLDGTLNSKSLTVSDYTVDNLAIGFSYAQGNFTLKDSSASWTGLPIKASGTVKNVLAEKPVLDINASLSLNPAALVKFVPDAAQYNLKGTVQAGIHVTGALPEPKLDLAVSSQELAAMDMLNVKNIKITTALTGDLTKLDNVDLDMTAQSVSVSGLGFQNVSAQIKKTGDTINLVSARASSGQGSLSGSGRAVLPEKGAGDLNFNVDMTRLDLRELSKTGNLGIDLAGTFSGKLAITGKMDAPSVAFQGEAPLLSVAGYGAENLTIQFKADISGKGASGHGNASAPSLRIYGMKLEDVSLPLALDGVNFKFGQGAAKLNGGTLSLNGNVNTQTLKYTGKLNVSNVDVNALIHDFVPDLSGNITGRGSMEATFNGSIDPKFTLGGSGQAKIGEGGISGFRWIDLISKLHGVNSVRYTEVTVPFKLETTRVILQKGAKATAPANDPLYKYAQVEGPVTYAGDLNMTGDGNMNFQLINAAAGGVLGAAGAIAGGGNINDLLSGKGLEGLLRQTVDRGTAAGRQADFRDVSFRIGGNAENPSFSVTKVGPSALPAEKSEPQQQQQQRPQDVVKDRVLDSLGIQTKQQNDTDKPDAAQKRPQAAPSNERQPQKKPEDIVKEEAGKVLRDVLRKR